MRTYKQEDYQNQVPPNTPNEIEAIVEEFTSEMELCDEKSCLKSCEEKRDWLRTTLTQLNANRTAEMEAREEASNRRGYAEGLTDGLSRKI